MEATAGFRFCHMLEALGPPRLITSVRPLDHVMPKSPSRKTADLQIAIADASRSSGVGEFATQKSKAQSGRIMYIECKAGSLTGPSRIGRVTFSKTGRTLYYRGQTFQSLKGAGFKSNCTGGTCCSPPR